MHKVKVVQPRYEQSRAYAGRTGEVIGHWGAESNSAGREGYLVEFEDGQVVGIAHDEVVNVSD